MISLMFRSKAAIGAAAVATALFLGGPAAAAVMSATCDAATTARVTPNIGCEYLVDLTPPAQDSETNVNEGSMFGIVDWSFLGKVDGLPGSDGGLTFVGDDQSGTWSISQAILDVYTNVMITFKSADSNADPVPSSIVGYLVNTTAGDYNAPSAFEDSTGYFDISHASLFVSGVNAGCDPITEICGPPVNEVPLPAGLPLLLAGLGAMGILSRRKKV